MPTEEKATIRRPSGIRFSRDRQAYTVYIWRDGKRHYIEELFDTEEQAFAARGKALREAFGQDARPA